MISCQINTEIHYETLLKIVPCLEISFVSFLIRLLEYLQSIHSNGLNCLVPWCLGLAPLKTEELNFEKSQESTWRIKVQVEPSEERGNKARCLHSPMGPPTSEHMEWNKCIIKEDATIIFYTCIEYQTPSKYVDFIFTSQID